MRVSIAGRLQAYVLLTMMSFTSLFVCVVLLTILPLKTLSVGLYRNLTTKVLEFAIPAFLLPATLAGLVLRVNDEHWKMMLHSRSWAPLSIIMCNHASRIDWLLAEWCGNIDRSVRVSFLTEGTMQFLPIVGWTLKLCEDIFLWRSFKVDKDTIDANINSFLATKTQRALFLAIEGAIVDQGLHDQRYIEECAEFCTSLGYKPFEYVLTPRYKGVHALAQHAGTELFSATTAFVRDGRLLNTKLTDPARVVPDLFTILSAPTEVTVHFDRLVIDADQELAKRQCMDNYKYRDEMIATFHERGAFPGGLVYSPLNKEWTKRALCFGAMVLLSQGAFQLIGRPQLFPKLIAGLFAVLSSCHWIGEAFSGQSRESIPFETIFKTYFYHGRDTKLRKQMDKSGANAGAGKEGSVSVAKALSQTAKMLSLATKFPAN